MRSHLTSAKIHFRPILTPVPFYTYNNNYNNNSKYIHMLTHTYIYVFTILRITIHYFLNLIQVSKKRGRVRQLPVFFNDPFQYEILSRLMCTLRSLICKIDLFFHFPTRASKIDGLLFFINEFCRNLVRTIKLTNRCCRVSAFWRLIFAEC